MNSFNLFNEMETKGPDGSQEVGNRREILKAFTGKAGKIALASLPIAVASLFQKAYAGPSTSTTVGILNYALSFEYLEQEFFSTGLQANGLIPTTQESNAFNFILTNDETHIAYLQKTIQSLGGTPITSPTFDFTGGSGSGSGPYADVFTNYATFLALAQVFKDVAIRAYKGQLATLVQGGALLTALMDIHSVEARHVSFIRQQRYNWAFATIKPWITLEEPGISAAFNPVYDGEQNTIQANVQIYDINGFNLNVEAASEAFDEPLSSTAVNNILQQFIAQGS